VRQARVERVAQAVAEQVEGQHGNHNRQAGIKDEVRRTENLVALRAEHRAPFGRRRLGAQAEEGKRGGVEDGGGNAERALHNQRGERVGQDASEKDLKIAAAQGTGGRDEIHFAHRKDAGAHTRA